MPERSFRFSRCPRCSGYGIVRPLPHKDYANCSGYGIVRPLPHKDYAKTGLLQLSLSLLAFASRLAVAFRLASSSNSVLCCCRRCCRRRAKALGTGPAMSSSAPACLLNYYSASAFAVVCLLLGRLRWQVCASRWRWQFCTGNVFAPESVEEVRVGVGVGGCLGKVRAAEVRPQ